MPSFRNGSPIPRDGAGANDGGVIAGSQTLRSPRIEIRRSILDHDGILQQPSRAGACGNADPGRHQGILNAMWDRLGFPLQVAKRDGADPRRFINRDVELTSRVQSSEIPGILQKLFSSYDGTWPSEAIDVCFATNMIQVGLDVPRLSMMTVVGQPKTTSEYIQASSRVGRDTERRHRGNQLQSVQA